MAERVYLALDGSLVYLQQGLQGRHLQPAQLDFATQDDPLLVMLVARLKEDAEKRLKTEIADPFFLAFRGGNSNIG